MDLDLLTWTVTGIPTTVNNFLPGISFFHGRKLYIMSNVQMPAFQTSTTDLVFDMATLEVRRMDMADKFYPVVEKKSTGAKLLRFWVLVKK